MALALPMGFVLLSELLLSLAFVLLSALLWALNLLKNLALLGVNVIDGNGDDDGHSGGSTEQKGTGKSHKTKEHHNLRYPLFPNISYMCN